MNILLVDDDYDFANTIKALILRWHHNVELAGTGIDALAALERKHFDLILIDIFLPDVKGYDMIAKIKAIRPDVRIITMTGYNTRELEQKVRQQGVLYYMIKPFQTGALRAILEHITKTSIKPKKTGTE